MIFNSISMRYLAVTAMLMVVTTSGCSGPTATTIPASSHPHAHGAPKTPAGIKPDSSGFVAPSGVPAAAIASFDELLAPLLSRRVLIVGETHDRLEHHLTQLEVIKRMHAQYPQLVIGMEYFHRPFQSVLDAYVAGDIDEQQMLRKTEYFDRWRFDFRLYRPILQYARDNGLKLLALNMEKEVTNAIRHKGMEDLSEDMKARLPRQYDRSDSRYEEELRAIFQQHPGRSHAGESAFKRFHDVQLTWDETMAETAADYLAAHPQAHMVILAGNGHVAYGSGIPNRLTRRVGDGVATIIPTDNRQYLTADAGDLLLFPEPMTLSALGKMGIYMSDAVGGVNIDGVSEGSGADKAGLEEGDLLISLDAKVIGDSTDVRLALMDAVPGQAVTVTVKRRNWLGSKVEQSVLVNLQGASSQFNPHVKKAP